LPLLKKRHEAGSNTGCVRLVYEAREGGIVLSGRLEVIVEDEVWIPGFPKMPIIS
jgi:hypothetical protein